MKVQDTNSEDKFRGQKNLKSDPNVSYFSPSFIKSPKAANQLKKSINSIFNSKM